MFAVRHVTNSPHAHLRHVLPGRVHSPVALHAVGCPQYYIQPIEFHPYAFYMLDRFQDDCPAAWSLQKIRVPSCLSLNVEDARSREVCELRGYLRCICYLLLCYSSSSLNAPWPVFIGLYAVIAHPTEPRPPWGEAIQLSRGRNAGPQDIRPRVCSRHSVGISIYLFLRFF